MAYHEIEGDLIKLAQEGMFDVIAHGCNCQCVMGAGIAPQMAKAFGADKFVLERDSFKGDINKLGTIEFEYRNLQSLKKTPMPTMEGYRAGFDFAVVNAYTQFDITGRRNNMVDLDYEALTLCMRKINHIFAGKHIGLPQIGCGLAGGSWPLVKDIIQAELSDCKVTIVNYKP